jgi:hypothetical protein
MCDSNRITVTSQSRSIKLSDRSRPSLEKLLELTVYLFAFFAVWHWASFAQLTNDRSHRVYCGNIISDPLSFLMNKMMPLAAVSVGTLIWCRFQARRRPLLPITILPLFLGTSLTLILETIWLHRELGLPTSSVWWCPWM